MKLTSMIATLPFAIVALTSGASAQSGPVATACKDEIVKHCAGKPHDGGVRVCLETNYEKVSAACKTALDTTGGGRGKGLGKSK